MSGFDLVPVGGGEPIRLPPGETVIGRGPLLRVSPPIAPRIRGVAQFLPSTVKPDRSMGCYVCFSSKLLDPGPAG